CLRCRFPWCSSRTRQGRRRKPARTDYGSSFPPEVKSNYSTDEPLSVKDRRDYLRNWLAKVRGIQRFFRASSAFWWAYLAILSPITRRSDTREPRLEQVPWTPLKCALASW